MFGKRGIDFFSYLKQHVAFLQCSLVYVIITKPPSHQPAGTSTWIPIVILINFLLFLNIAEDNLGESLPLLCPSEVSGGSGGLGGISDRDGKLS